MILKYILCAVIAYLLGSISTGIIYSRALGQDIRTQGSKNAGATNMTRVHGWGKGGITFLGDCLKGVLATLIGKWIGGEIGMLLGFTFAAIGHMWPLYFGFKGGKGVATMIGAGFVVNPLVMAIAVALGVAAMFITQYVSVGSMTGFAVFAIGMVIVRGFWPVGLWIMAVAALGFWRHRSNIQRLMNGTENKLSQLMGKK